MTMTALQVQSKQHDVRRTERRASTNTRMRREFEYIAYDAAHETDEPAVKRLACKCKKGN